MTMTIKVYEVDRAGTVRVLRPETEVVPLEIAEARTAYPPCACPRHRAGSDAAYRTYLTHTHLCATCRAGAPCPTVARLGQAWKATR